MSPKKGYLKLNITTASVLLGLIFSTSVWLWEIWSRGVDEQHIEQHARIISSALWNFDDDGPVNYLHIAMRLNNYARITIFALSDPAPFIEVTNRQKRQIDHGLERIGLINRRIMSTPIYYQREIIGHLEVLHVNKRIYLYLNWFLVMCLIWVGMKFFLQMVQGKRLLETRVAERTAELQDSKDNLSVTLDSIGDGVIATDIHGKVVQMNSIAAVIIGRPLADVIGRNFTEIFPSSSPDHPNESPDFVARIFETGSRTTLITESKVYSNNGNQYLISLSGAPIRKFESGDVMGVVFVFRDITEESALQEQLRQSEKMRAIGQLAGGIAHDFNNMLGIIMGAGELLRDIVPSTPKSDKYLDILSGAAETAAGLADKLLVFSRRRAPSIETVNLHQIIKDTISLLQSTIDRRIDVEMACTTKACWVRGDQPLLQSAFLNIGINASHAIEKRGSITYRIQAVEMHAHTYNLQTLQIEPGSYLEISIVDTGHGISPDVLPHIFEPFFTTRLSGKGTGLGLAAVEATIQQHGGAITVSSELGHGTTFKIYLPIANKNENTANEVPKDFHAGSELILLIDDEDFLRESTSTLLKDMGYHVLTAANGLEGLHQFKAHASEIDLVILDMIMPEMNGRDCFAELQKVRPDARIILSTGFCMEEDIEEMKKNGLCHFLNKPFHKEDLARAVYCALHDPRTES